MNTVVCKRCGFAIGSCVCDERHPVPVVLPTYKDDSRLIALLEAKEKEAKEKLDR